MGEEAGIEAFVQPPVRFQLCHPRSLPVGNAAACFRHGKIDLALVGGVDIGGGEQLHLDGPADHGRIARHNVAQGDTGRTRNESHGLVHFGGVCRVDMECFRQRPLHQCWIIGCQQKARIFATQPIRINHAFAEGDRQRDRGLLKGGEALSGHRKQQCRQEKKAGADCQEAENAKPRFGAGVGV